MAHLGQWRDQTQWLTSANGGTRRNGSPRPMAGPGGTAHLGHHE
ncbi:hypothetical protein [Tengunoibacter tsumagoiensis]|nr:hypothetical protein [Tengunoibacter tsumagoiensis]